MLYSPEKPRRIKEKYRGIKANDLSLKLPRICIIGDPGVAPSGVVFIARLRRVINFPTSARSESCHARASEEHRETEI